MTSSPAGTTEAVKNNAQIFTRMAKLLEASDQYPINVDKLAAFLNDSRAYYNPGRGQIANLLEIAHDRLKTVLDLDRSSPLNANKHLSHPWVEHYIKLIRVVAKFTHKFQEPHLKEKVLRLVATVNEPESPSHIIDVDAVEDIQDHVALRVSQPQQMYVTNEASAPPCETPVISAPEAVSTAPNVQSTMTSAQPGGHASESGTPKEVKPKRKKPKTKINYSALLDLEKSAQLDAAKNEQPQTADLISSAFSGAPVSSELYPPPDSLPPSVTEDEKTLSSTNVQTSSSAPEPMIVSTPRPTHTPTTVEERPPVPSAENVIHGTAVEMEVDVDESKFPDQDIPMKDSDENNLEESEQQNIDEDVNMHDHIQTDGRDMSANDDHNMQCDQSATEVSEELCALTENNSGLLGWKIAIDERSPMIDQSENNQGTEKRESLDAEVGHLEKEASIPGDGELPDAVIDSNKSMNLTPEIVMSASGNAAPSSNLPSEGDLAGNSTNSENARRKSPASTSGELESSAVLDAKDDVEIAPPLASTISGFLQNTDRRQRDQSLDINSPALESPRQISSHGTTWPTPEPKGLPGSSTPISARSVKSATPMRETGPVKIPKLFIPAIDGFNNSMKVPAFHPVPPRGSVDFTLEINSTQMKSFTSWNQRRDPESPKNNIHKSRCLSLACYTAKDIERIKNEASVAAVNGLGYQYFNKIRSTFPSTDRLRLQIVTQNGKKHTIPLSLFPFLTRDGLIDLGNYIKEGPNVIKLYRPQTSLSEDFVFVLHVHSPTRAQLLELEKELADKASWNNWFADFARPFDIASSPFAGLP